VPDARTLLRHTLATLAYRGGKALAGAPAGFSAFSVREGSRTPGQVLAHLCDLMDWAAHMAAGRSVWRDTAPGEWEADVARFRAGLSALDDAIVASPDAPLERLFQGPIADALTHVGQIAMLRRMAGAPVRGENYSKADIAAGRLEPLPGARRVEFD